MLNILRKYLNPKNITNQPTVISHKRFMYTRAQKILVLRATCKFETSIIPKGFIDTYHYKVNIITENKSNYITLTTKPKESERFFKISEKDIFGQPRAQYITLSTS